MPLIAKLVEILHIVDTTEVYTEVIVTRGKRNEPSMFAPLLLLLSVGNIWSLKAPSLPCSPPRRSVSEKQLKRRRVIRLQIAGGKEREKEAHLNLSAMRMQSLIRGCIGRRVAHDRRQHLKSVKLQQFVRAQQARAELRRRQHDHLIRSCAVAIQAQARGWKSRQCFATFLRQSMPFSHGSWDSALAALRYQRDVKKRYKSEPEKKSNICDVSSVNARVATKRLYTHMNLNELFSVRWHFLHTLLSITLNWRHSFTTKHWLSRKAMRLSCTLQRFFIRHILWTARLRASCCNEPFAMIVDEGNMSCSSKCITVG